MIMVYNNQEERDSLGRPAYLAEEVESVIEQERRGGESESAPQVRERGTDGHADTKKEAKRRRRRRRGEANRRHGRALLWVVGGAQHAVGSILGGVRHPSVRRVFNTVVGFILGKPVQTSLVVLNIFLVKTAMTALRRARFAASVRVVKDLKRADDLRYLLGQLPPWISSPEWEAGKPVQELLGLLWPALNSTICLALKNVIEDRMHSSAEYGHIKFSRFSLGRNPPVICGIKAVPLHEEDLLALVVDVDLRWAGEPDVALSLTKMSRASLGLKNLQVSAMVRLVFSPIIEDPPFLQRMTVSLLNKPLIDFNLRALGGPDIMSLPAISSWLHAAILNVTDRFIVWPKEVSVPLVPSLRQKNMMPVHAWKAPLGILVIKVEEAKLQKRRSTFLGRYKLPNPRIGLVSPKDAEDGVPQMTLTKVQEKTLAPTWHHSRVFVIGSESQPLRFLLSHRRVENFFGADMPLGSAEVDVSDLLRHCADNASGKSFKSCLSGKSSFKEAEMDEFESASSTPVQFSPTKRVAWASPSFDAGPHADAQNEQRSCGTNPLADMLLESDESSNSIESRVFAHKQNGHGIACPWTPPTKTVPWQKESEGEAESAGVRRLKTSTTKERLRSSCQQGSTWIDINSSPVMTMSGLVSGALLPRADGTPAPFEPSYSETNSATWFNSIKQLMMRSAFADHDSDNESNADDNHAVNLEQSSFGKQTQSARVKVSFKWIPIDPSLPPPGLKVRKRLTDQSYAGVLGIRVAFTKIDYGDSPPNPVLSFSVVRGPAQQTEESQTSMYSLLQKTTASQNSLGNHRVFSTDCQTGSRPGVLHWGGQVFHVPVWDAEHARVRVELGNISSALKLSSYGTELFLLEASSGSSFDNDVEVEASANIPLKAVLIKGVVEGNYRLREAKTEKLAGVNDEQRLDIGRIVLTMSWFPFSSDLND